MSQLQIIINLISIIKNVDKLALNYTYLQIIINFISIIQNVDKLALNYTYLSYSD